MIGVVGRLRRVDRHAADGVFHGMSTWRRGYSMSVVLVHFSHRSRLAIYTPWGYIGRMRKDIKATTVMRLNRIEGQVRGLTKMVEDDRYCIDIVTQIAAVRAALDRAEDEILRDHVSTCVEHAISSGDKADQRAKIAELMEVFGRAKR